MSGEERLCWSAQYSVLAEAATPRTLIGDRLILPSQALERLIKALDDPTSAGTLIFRLVNPLNDRVSYAGVREFSADGETMAISAYMRSVLGLREGNACLTVHLSTLPKGDYVKLRPLEAGYDAADWKALLERYLRETYTTLVCGQELTVSVESRDLRFIVDNVKPDGKAISIIDTDLEVDIEALDEEQARETVKRLADRRQIITLLPGSTVQGQIQSEQYIDYVVGAWDKDKDVIIELDSSEDINLLVSPFGLRQRTRPRLEEHVFCDVGSSQTKRVSLSAAFLDLEKPEAIYLAVHGYGRQSASYELKIHHELQEEEAKTGERCSNCQQIVPSSTMFLHQNFCLRNNVRCEKCSNVFQKSSDDWTNHWHCDHDRAHGNSQNSHVKHDTLFHASHRCSRCSFEAEDISSLASHRTGQCPRKLILCQFCHLETAQKGPDDPELLSAEVILSGLTPHEVTDGARTTECHLCSKIMRLRDMQTHLKHHDLQRWSRMKPRKCRNDNCGYLLHAVDSQGNFVSKAEATNELGLCEACYGPLYTSQYDPEGRALQRRLGRKILTQLLTGCKNPWCQNLWCKTAQGLTLSNPEASQQIQAATSELALHLCVDEQQQRRQQMAALLAIEAEFELEWCLAALAIKKDDLQQSRDWLHAYAPSLRRPAKDLARTPNNIDV